MNDGLDINDYTQNTNNLPLPRSRETDTRRAETSTAHFARETTLTRTGETKNIFVNKIKSHSCHFILSAQILLPRHDLSAGTEPRRLGTSTGSIRTQDTGQQRLESLPRKLHFNESTDCLTIVLRQASDYSTITRIRNL